MRKWLRAAGENIDAALLWLAFEPAGRYLNWRNRDMTEANTPKAAVIEVMKVVARWRDSKKNLDAADEIMDAIMRGMPGEGEGS